MKILKEERIEWVEHLCRITRPVYTRLAEGRFNETVPTAQGQNPQRKQFAALEALGRSLAGIGPWLQCEGLNPEEKRRQDEMIGLVLSSLDRASDPDSVDFVNFSEGEQPLVDAAFLALGLLRSRTTIWNRLDGRVRKNLITGFKMTRKFKPGFSNWLLFSATIEAFFCQVGEEWDRMRIDYALRQHEQWYKGDGAYGDGPFYHHDYYNSFVIQPMLLEVLDQVGEQDAGWKAMAGAVRDRALRHAAVQERMIGPDGSFPPLGRSLVYRSGAFQHLAVMALRNDLPDDITPAQVRCALGAMMKRTLDAPGTFDSDGWLTIGLSGCQPSLAESYISTGSLYLCACSLLPLGLAPDHAFWSNPAEDWTAKKIWAGKDLPADRALHDK